MSSAEQQQRDAREAALWSAAASAAEIALLLTLSWALHHRAEIRARAAALLARARRRPRVDELALADWAREVDRLAHGEPL